MSFFKVSVEFWKDKEAKVDRDLYFSINSQDAFFQLKYWHMMGIELLNSSALKYFSNGESISKLNILDLENMSTWARSIMSYKKQIGTIQILKERKK